MQLEYCGQAKVVQTLLAVKKLLNFLHFQVAGMLKLQPQALVLVLMSNGPIGGISTILFLLVSLALLGIFFHNVEFFMISV